MSQGRPAGSFISPRNEFMSSVYMNNKGLASLSRQQRKEQTQTRPVLDYTTVKHHNFPENEQLRQNIELMQPAAVSYYHQRKPPKTRENVKFNETINNHLTTKDDVKQRKIKSQDTQHKQIYSKPIVNEQLLKSYKTYIKESDSDTDGDIDSLYDNDKSFRDDQSESIAEPDFNISEEINQSIDHLQKGIHKITNRYVRRVKSQVEIAMSKLKLQEKKKPQQKKKADERAAGDKKKPQETEELYQKMEMMKKECYRKIEANLNTLKNIDSVTTEIYHNYAAMRSGQ